MIDQGVLQLRLGKLEDAAASFRLTRELGAEAHGIDGLGCVAFLQGDYEIAESRFKEALQVDPGYVTALANLALLYDLLGRVNEATRLYEIVVQRDPTNFRSRNNFGVLLIRDGERERGIDALREARSLVPEGISEANIKSVER
jgi:Flp pilus assembly protein TadD